MRRWVDAIGVVPAVLVATFPHDVLGLGPVPSPLIGVAIAGFGVVVKR